MKFTLQEKRFSFYLGETPAWELPYVETVQETDTGCVREYQFAGGVKVTNRLQKYGAYGAYEWYNELENTSDTDSANISRLNDCDIAFPVEPDPVLPDRSWMQTKESTIRVFAPNGSVWSETEFFCNTGVSEMRETPHFLENGKQMHYVPDGGRSSSGMAPFFDLFRGKGETTGLLAAIGWTGRWNCNLSRENDRVRLQTGIADLNFVLHPGEKIRTSSILLLPYADGRVNAHNRFRRLLKDLAPIGKEGQPKPPFCAVIWGGMTTEQALERVNAVADNELPVDTYWMDAGWYGMDESPSPNEFEGKWPHFTGDWRVNPYKHPDGLLDYVRTVKAAGRRVLLWFEPERVRLDVPIALEHPEYLLKSSKDDPKNSLLNLGDPAAWNYCYEMLSESIERLQLDILRIDFNFDPLNFWRENDEENRIGLREIYYINGLYRLWDALLARFPGLMIDNCASGGRRIDIEMMKRSIPLWRSDAACPANCSPELLQNHNLAYCAWLPYSGTGTGRIWGDVYRFRSSYSPALGTQCVYAATDVLEDSPEKFPWLKQYLEEYRRVQPYFWGDFYPLTEPEVSDTVWSAARWDRPEENDGMILAFRRSASLYDRMNIPMQVEDGSTVTFTDEDTGETVIYTAEELNRNGYALVIPEQRMSKLIFYRKQ